MKKQISTLFLLLFTIWISNLTAQSCTGNLLQNAGFENGLTNWEGVGEIVSTGANSGTKALKSCASQSTRQTLTAQAGITYTLNGFLKREGTSSVFIFMKFMTSSFIPIISPYAQWELSQETPGSWVALNPLVWVAPANTAFIEISVIQNSGSSCIYVDDLCLTNTVVSSCPKSHSNPSAVQVLCGEKTASGYQIVASSTPTSVVVNEFDETLNLVNSFNSTIPERFNYNISNGNLIKTKADNTTIYTKPIPLAITNQYGLSGTGCENVNGGYYLTFPSGVNTVVLTTNSTFGVLNTKIVAPNPIYTTAQTPVIITPSVGGGYILGVEIPLQFASPLTRIIKVNASNTTQYEFNITGKAIGINLSACGTNRYSISTFGQEGSVSSLATYNTNFEIDFGLTSSTFIRFAQNISNNYPGGFANINTSIAYYFGYSVQFENSSTTNTINGQTIKTARVFRMDGANPTATWQKTLPTDVPNEIAIVFEKGAQNAVLIGKNWTFDTECGTPTGLTLNTPTDVNYTECLQVAGGPVCTNCHTIIPPTATTNCGQGGATVIYDGYTTLSGTMTVNDPNGSQPLNLPAFGFVTRGFGQVEVRFRATDACGNTATTSYKISNTQTDPNINFTSCPSNIVVTAATGQTGAIVTYPTPTITALCGPTAPTTASNTVSGSTFPIGTTSVTWSAANASQTKLCQFTVTVNPAGNGGGGTCANNLLQNASFESNLSNWGNDGGSATVVTGGNTGTKSVKICTNGTRIYQTKPAIAGKTYTLKTFAKNDGTGSPNCLQIIKFLNASFSPIDQVFGALTATSTSFVESTNTLLAPPNTAYIEVSLSKNNGVGCVIVDDVCLTESGTGGGNNLPDFNLANITFPSPSVVAGSVFSFKFDLKNIGTGNATGNYNIKSYISTDNVLSANDIQDGVIPTGNLNAGATIQQVTGAATIPTNLAAGTYYLILKVDADNTITESDENNNILASATKFTVTTGGVSTGADLEITLTADKTNVAQWNSVTYTLTAKNTGNTTITNAVIQVNGCNGIGFFPFNQAFGLVYAGIPAVPTKGTFNSVAQQWTLSNLMAGQSGILTFTLFALNNAEKKVVALSVIQNPTDPDSQPTNNVLNCTPTQDDEAIWTINMGQGLLSSGTRDLSTFQNATNLEQMPDYQLFPNPAGEVVFIKLSTPKSDAMPQSQPITKVTLINQMGLVEKIQEFFPTNVSVGIDDETEKIHELSLQGIKNGVYLMKIEVDGQRTVVRKLVVSRMY
jgi:hypothetical protein